MPNDEGFNYQPYPPDPYNQSATGPTSNDMPPTYPPAGGYPPPPTYESQPAGYPPPPAAPPPAYGAAPQYPSAYPQPQYAAAGYAPAAMPMAPRTSGMAIASLVCSLLGLCTGFTPILGVIFGHLALNEIKRSNGMVGGKGLAMSGLIIGYIFVGLAIVGLVLILLVSAAANAG